MPCTRAVQNLKPGDLARLEVEISGYSEGDAIQVRIAMKGLMQQFYVPTASLKLEPSTP